MTPTILEQISKNKHRRIVWTIDSQAGWGGGIIIYRDMFTHHNLLINLGRNHYKHYGEAAQLRCSVFVEH